MLAYVNGQYIPEDRDALTVNDRSFLYGDGLFETIRITNGQPFLWREHLGRLERGAAFLKIPIPSSAVEIEQATRHLLSQNDTPEGFVRIHLSRGASNRGYSTHSANKPILIITTHNSIHSQHPGLKLITSTIRILADDPLAQFKTANRLSNILARQQADAAQADEALLLNNHNQITEASGANIFIIRGDQLITPPLSSGALAGTTRSFILTIAAEHKVTPVEAPLTAQDLQSANSTFLSSAHFLAAPVLTLDGAPLRALSTSVVNSLRAACQRAALGQ